MIDPLERYGVSPKIGAALHKTLERIAAREGSALPSSDVIAKALTVLGTNARDRDISHSVTPATVYKVPSSSRPGRHHMVVLYIRPWSKVITKKVKKPDGCGPIIDAECSCEATTVCSHLLVALTYAERDGYHLETGR